jgi:hypothetical protein
MPQADRNVANSTFPSVRADINDNLAALYSQSSGNSDPSLVVGLGTVAYQPWIDTSGAQPVWKVRNSSNTGWVTIGTFAADGTFGSGTGGVTSIANGGTGATTAAAALGNLLPSQTGNSGKALVTISGVASWGTVAGASGASIQVFTSSAQSPYTPTTGKTTFLVLAIGGGGGGGGAFGAGSASRGSGGGGAGTALRLYTSTELGTSATFTIGAAGTGGAINNVGATGGNTTFTPGGVGGLAIQGTGGGGGGAGAGGGAGGGTTNSILNTSGSGGMSSSLINYGGVTLFAGGNGNGGTGGAASTAGSAGQAGAILILEW